MDWLLSCFDLHTSTREDSHKIGEVALAKDSMHGDMCLMAKRQSRFSWKAVLPTLPIYWENCSTRLSTISSRIRNNSQNSEMVQVRSRVSRQKSDGSFFVVINTSRQRSTQEKRRSCVYRKFSLCRVLRTYVTYCVFAFVNALANVHQL